MLKITISSIELYDEVNNEFISSKEQTLTLEHSLVSLSKWESKWGKPFMSKDEKTFDESVDYIRCMTITQNVPEDTYSMITKAHIAEVNKYLEMPMTATVIHEPSGGPSREVVTSEIIYYWMIALNIPMECQKWHLNRLITLINVCRIKNTPAKKMSKSAIAERNAAVNAARKQSLNTKG